MNKKGVGSAEGLHENVPPDWYYQSLKIDPFQKFWHKRRFEEVTAVIDPVEGDILDIGSADGVFSKVIFKKAKPKHFVGIDVVKTSVDWANKHWEYVGKMKFMVADAGNLPFESQTFDAVFALEVLEHVFDPTLVLEEIKRVLKKGGYAVFLVPSDSLLFRIIWFLWLHFYPRGWVWRETHIQTYRNNFLSKICKKVGFKIEIDKKFNMGMLHLVKVRK
jgi:ubiquinone/menaquinone biosynthesis C-methylase UbiE